MSTDKNNRRGTALAAPSPMEQDCLQSLAADRAEKQERKELCSPVFPARHGTLASSRLHKRRGTILSYVIAVFVFVAMFSAFMTKRTMTDTHQVMLTRGIYKNQYFSRAIAELYRGTLLSNHKYTRNDLAVKALRGDEAITVDNVEVQYKDTGFEAIPYLQCIRSFLEGRTVDLTSTPSADLDIDLSNIPGIKKIDEKDSNKLIYTGYFAYLHEAGMKNLLGTGDRDKYRGVTPGYYVAFMNGGNGKRMRAWQFTSVASAKDKYKLNPREFTLFNGILKDKEFTDNTGPLCFYAVTMGLWADYPVTNASQFLVNALTIRTNDTKPITDPQYLEKVKDIVQRHSKDVAECISYPAMNDRRVIDILSDDPDFAELKPYLTFSLSTAIVPVYESAMYQIKTYY